MCACMCTTVSQCNVTLFIAVNKFVHVCLHHQCVRLFKGKCVRVGAVCFATVCVGILRNHLPPSFLDCSSFKNWCNSVICVWKLWHRNLTFETWLPIFEEDKIKIRLWSFSIFISGILIIPSCLHVGVSSEFWCGGVSGLAGAEMSLTSGVNPDLFHQHHCHQCHHHDQDLEHYSRTCLFHH